MKSTKLNKHKEPIYFTLILLSPYLHFILDTIDGDFNQDRFTLYIYLIFPTLIAFGAIWTYYFMKKIHINKTMISVNTEEILHDYNKCESLASYKYEEKYVTLKGKIKEIDIEDKDCIELKLFSDDKYIISIINLLPKKKYIKYIKTLSVGDEICVKGMLFKEDNLLQLLSLD